LQGKSLAPVILGMEVYSKNFKLANSTNRSWVIPDRSSGNKIAEASGWIGIPMPSMVHNFAISQVIRCAPLAAITRYEELLAKQLQSLPSHRQNNATEGGSSQLDSETASLKSHKPPRQNLWTDCDINKKNQADEIVLMGYSMRTTDYRYTAYFYYNKTTERPYINQLPYQQELYDHKMETLSDFTHRETSNLAYRPSYAMVVESLRSKLVNFISKEFVFRVVVPAKQKRPA
jgi:hypothetical protein